MKRLLATLCTFALCATIFVPISAEATDPGIVNAILDINNSLMNESFNNQSTLTNISSNKQIEISLNTEAATANIRGDIVADLSGVVDRVICDDGIIGYVGTYEGTLLDGTSIIADVVYDSNDIFAAITLGPLTTDSFDLTLYGAFTDSLKEISTKYSSDIMTYRESALTPINSEDDLTPAPFVQGETVYQGSDLANADDNSTYMVGQTSFYFAEELRNQGVMSVYAKVNTKCSRVEDYLIDVEGFRDSLVVYPDTFNISICGNNADLHAIENTYLPKDGSTSATITIPIYGGPVVGLQFISFKTKMSSTDVTTSRYSSSSPYPNNKVSWDIYKKYGWTPTDTDGSPSTDTGMVASADYTYGGNISTSRTTSMTAKTSIRYEYQYTFGGSPMVLHLTTDEMSVTASLKIVP